MSQRSLFPGPHMPTPENDQIWNGHHPGTHLPLGNGSYMLPSDNNAGSTAVLRPVGYPSTNFLNYATSSGPSHDPYVHLPSAASSSHYPPDQYPCVPPPSTMMHPQTEIERSEFKRKNPVIPVVYNGVNSNGCYNVGSYSNPLQQKPLIMHQYGPLDPASSTHIHGSGSHVIIGDDANRNVRSRHINPQLPFSSSNLPHHFHAEQLIHISTMPMAPQRDPRFNYEGNHSVSGMNFLNNSIVNNSAFHPNISQSINSSSVPSHHDPSPQVVANNNGFNPRANPYCTSSSHTPVGFSSVSLENTGFPGMEYAASSRHSRPIFITGRSSYRNGRPRSSNSRFLGGYVEDDTRSSRWSSEGTIMMDQSTVNNSRSWFHQHMDMMLDIDNMSYEELLALGERIGHVNTGLSDETIVRCLEETTFRCLDDIEAQEEEKCAICLEEYEDQIKVGRLPCKHDFHLRCIKIWLQIKNACPICKATASRDAEKGKQL